MQIIYPRVTVQHNHGFITFENAIIENDTIKGTIVAGQSTDRLFGCTKTTQEQKGTQGSYPLYGSKLREQCVVDYDNKCMKSPTPGVYEVDCTFCG